MEPHPPADWFEFWVRFVCGAFFGVVAVVGAFGDGSASQVWPLMAASGVIFGVVAGWFGDRFWHSLRHFL